MATFKGFVGQSYQSDSLVADAQSAVNLYLEAVESGEGQNTAYMRETPGLMLSQTLPTSPCRGVWIGEGRMFVVYGSKLYEVWAPLAGTVNTINSSGTTLVTWVSGAQFSAVLTGAHMVVAGTGYTIQSVTDATHLVLSTNAGTQTAAVFTIPYNQIGDVGSDGLPVQIFPNGNQLFVVSAGQAWVAVSESSIIPAIYPNRFGDVSTDPTGLIIAWVDGAKFDATMVGNTIFIDSVPFTVNSFTSATQIGIATAAPASLTLPYNAALAVIGTGSSSGTTTLTQTAGGPPFFDSADGTMVGNTITIAGATYTVAAVTDGTHLVTDSAIPSGTGLAYSAIVPVFASQGAFLDGVFIVAKPLSKQMNNSAIDDGTIWDLLNTATKQAYPDNIAALLSDHEELYVFGTTAACEVWRTNPASTAFTCQRDPGAIMQHGNVATYATVRLGEGVAFLGGDPRGFTIAYRATGYVPVRISTHPIETAWKSYATTSDAVAFVYIEDGHEFWVIHFPTGNATWCYDATAGTWHRRGWWNGTSLDRQRQAFHGYVFGNHYVGDWQNGNLYIQSSSVGTDNGTLIQRQRAAPHLNTENLWSFYNYFEILTESGTGITFTLDWSDDGGIHWHAGITATPNGATGVYGQRVRWRRLGRSRDRIFRLTWTSSTKTSLVNAFLGVTQGNG